MAERKEGVLEILLNAGQDFLDDQSLVSGLKEAKAKVFESLNELVAEKKVLGNLEESSPGFRACSEKIRCFIDLCYVVKRHDCSFDFLPGEVFTTLGAIEGCPIGKLSSELINRCLDSFTLSLHKDLRMPFCTFARIVETSQTDAFRKILRTFDNYLENKDGAESIENFMLESSLACDARTIHQTSRYLEEKESVLIPTILESSRQIPILLLNCSDTDQHFMPSTDFIYYLSVKAGARTSPKILSLDESASLQDLRSEFETCEREGRWLVLERPEKIFSKLIQLDLTKAGLGDHFRVFALSQHCSRVESRARSLFKVFSIVLPRGPDMRQHFFETLLSRGGEKYKSVWSRYIRLHLAMSERVGCLQPAKLVDVMVAKCGIRWAESAEQVAKVAHQVYSERVGVEEIEKLWKDSHENKY